MQSLNFEILRPSWPDLAELGAFAERYAYSDPASALVKMRLFIERMVDGHPMSRLDQLLPWNWKPAAAKN